MKLKHNNKVIANKIIYFENPLLKTFGLRFSKELEDKEALILVNKKPTRINSTIDMFFVFFNLDILWLDENYKVVDIKRNVKPFTIKMPREKASYVIEMRENTTKNIKIGDKLELS